LGKIKNKSLTVNQIEQKLLPLGFYALYSENEGVVYVGYNRLHVDMFKTLIKRLYPHIKTWTDEPRGRVFYDNTNYKFICIMDKCLDTEQMRKRIRKEFKCSNLEFNFDDSNYTCLDCKQTN
jgi:hypothetical protein